MNLDHVVVHIDNNERILSDLKKQAENAGVPFEPSWGKGTKGFKASNIWIGRQYFEIIRLLKPDGGGWEERWVSSYNAGKRGVFCLFLQTNDIRSVANRLRADGLSIDGPKRQNFKGFFGLFKKTLPWELIYLPPIPGTDLEIGFIQYDPDPKDRIKQFLVPNAEENGIDGITSAEVVLPLSSEAREFLQQIFPEAKNSTQEWGCLSIADTSAFKMERASK
jgi:Glyoxalase-like domain